MVIIAIKVPVRPIPAEQCTRTCFYFYRKKRLRSTRASRVGRYSGVTTILSSHTFMFSCSTYFSVSPSEIQIKRLIRPGSGKVSSVKRTTLMESSSFVLFPYSLQYGHSSSISLIIITINSMFPSQIIFQKWPTECCEGSCAAM